MLAIIKTGGKQYIVREGDSLEIEKVIGNEGDNIKFDQVFLIADKDVKIGTPNVEGAIVEGNIEKQFKDKKVIIQKFKRKTGYRRRTGHRQMKTKIKITKITI